MTGSVIRPSDTACLPENGCRYACIITDAGLREDYVRQSKGRLCVDVIGLAGQARFDVDIEEKSGKGNVYKTAHREGGRRRSGMMYAGPSVNVDDD